MKSFLKTLAAATVCALTILGGITFIFALSVLASNSFLGYLAYMFAISKGNMRLVVFGVIVFIIVYFLVVKIIQQHKELKKKKW